MKRLFLLSSGSLWATLIFYTPAAYALNECGTGTTVTCSGNFDATGITYNQPASTSVTVADGTIINFAGQGLPAAVSLSTKDASRLTIGADTVINTTGVSSGISASGLNVVEIFSAANITTRQGRGIDATISSSLGTATATPVLTVVNTGSIAVQSINAMGISALSQQGGSVAVTSSGDITTAGSGGWGIFARSFFSGTVVAGRTVDVKVSSTGSILTSGANAHGVYAWAEYGADVTVDAANIATTGLNAYGIFALSTVRNGSAGGTGNVSVTTTGTISSAQGSSIYASSESGDVTINVNSGRVHGGSDAVMASSLTGVATINIAAAATVDGDNGAVAILENAQSTGSLINAQGRVTSAGYYGIWAAGHGVIGVTATDVAVTGTADGIIINSLDATAATMNVVNVSASGEDVAALVFISDAAAAPAAGSTNTVNVASNGVVTGGWSAVAATDPSFRASALLLATNITTTVNNAGTLTAGSDMAVLSKLMAGETSQPLTINNSGTILGSMLFDARNVTFTNLAGGVYDLRSFADTDGDGVQNAKAVGVANFGGGGNVFVNDADATLRLAGVTGEQSVDTTGQYLPQGASVHDISQTGVVQGQLLNLSRFENSGTIDLRGGIAGNVLVISGGQTAGVDGGGVFVANGGVVKLNTVLNEGGANSQSDILVVDSTRLGTGATSIAVTPVNGVIGNTATVGNGILLIEVLNKGASASGAFALNGRIASPVYEYSLYHNGIANDAIDGNWYLRNTVIPSATPDNPIPQPVPELRPEVPVSMAISLLAIDYGYAMLGTLHERSAEAYFTPSIPTTEERVVRCNDAKLNYKCVVRVPVANGNGAGKDETRWARSGWARLLGDRGSQEANNFDRRGPDYDYTFSGIQAGLDVFAHEHADGALDKAGVYVGYGQVSSNVKGQFGDKAGSVDTDAYTVGAYWTHRSAQGWYTDAVAQSTWYSTDARSIYGQQMKPSGVGILGSLEGGYSFKLGNGFTLEPQAQVVYQKMSFDNAQDAFGVMRFDDGDSLRGRLGLRAAKSWNMAEQGREPRLVTAWLRTNIWHEFLGKTKTSFGSFDGQSNTSFNTHFGGTWGEVGAGVSAHVSDRVSIMATGAYNRSLDNKGRQGWDGRLGMTVKW